MATLPYIPQHIKDELEAALKRAYPDALKGVEGDLRSCYPSIDYTVVKKPPPMYQATARYPKGLAIWSYDKRRAEHGGWENVWTGTRDWND